MRSILVVLLVALAVVCRGDIYLNMKEGDVRCFFENVPEVRDEAFFFAVRPPPDAWVALAHAHRGGLQRGGAGPAQ